MELNVRGYAQGDRKAVEAMAREVVADGTVFPFEAVAGVLGYWFEDGAEVFVACRESEVVGTYVLKPNHPDRGAHVANAGYMVSQASRGAGVGEALGHHSLATARALGYRAMQFNQVVATNGAAIRLWQRLGFETVGVLPQTFRHPEQGYVDTLVMFRTL